MSYKARDMVRSLRLAAALALILLASGASAEGLTEQQQFARGIYQELVEINTTTATGDTQKAAEAMGARLRAAGFPHLAEVLHVHAGLGQAGPGRGGVRVVGGQGLAGGHDVESSGSADIVADRSHARRAARE